MILFKEKGGTKMFKKIKKRKPNYVIILSALIVLVSVISILLFTETNELKTSEILAIATAIIGVISLGNEMRRGKNLAEAEFLVNLNNIFTSNDDYKEAYIALDSYDFQTKPDLTLTNSTISNYLTFFETFYLLIKRKVITISMVDDLFSYRFFIAVHNPHIQKVKIFKSPENFKNIFCLEKMWMEYRIENKLSLFKPEYSFKIVFDDYKCEGEYSNYLHD